RNCRRTHSSRRKEGAKLFEDHERHCPAKTKNKLKELAHKLKPLAPALQPGEIECPCLAWQDKKMCLRLLVHSLTPRSRCVYSHAPAQHVRLPESFRQLRQSRSSAFPDCLREHLPENIDGST